jgi:adenine-specific DNA-methyltransferase
MPESRQELRTKLQKKLRELFQFNKSDLNFGIYRILNRKRDEIEAFIKEDLLNAIEKGLEEYTQDDESQLDELKQEIKNTLGEQAFENGGLAEQYENTPLGKKYLQAKKKADKQEVGEEIEKRIYQDLYTFFSRYYDDGDFLTQRRISTRDSKYAIPYNGEEVKLHWANKDQYYIKTGEHFANYKFEANGLDVWFKVQQAEVEKDNVKESDTRYFVLRPDDPIEIDEEKDTLTLWFEYRPLKDEEEEKWLEIYNEAAGKSLKTIDRERLCTAFDDWVRSEVTGRWRDALSTMPDDKEHSLLYEKLNHFTAKNTTDYFIHKNLQEFLDRELEYYLKHEVIKVDDFIKADSEQPLQTALTRAKVVRGIAEKIITFLSQIEDFQKKLFEKKKFVVDTHYCVTLDKVPEELYETILENEKQLAYWEECYSMDEWEKNLEWNGEWTEAVLKSHPYMMVDTKFFEDDFKYEVLACFDDLDEELGGLLIHGENFQGISVLNGKFGNVKCIYIDPPYNAKSSEILYKNNFKHSSWLSMMENRLSNAKSLMDEDGCAIIAIDENERERLSALIDTLFPSYEKTCISVVHNPAGVQGNNFSYSHESAFFIFPSGGEYIGYTERKDPLVSPLRDWGGTSPRELAKNCFYPIIVEDNEIVEFGEVCDEDFHPEAANVKHGDKTYIYPIDSKGVERKWVFSRNSVEKNQDQLFLKEQDGDVVVMRKKTKRKYRTVWTDKKYYANIYGSRLLSHLFGEQNFSFPKSVHTVEDSVSAITSVRKDGSYVLDYFAGSGTTGHAVLNLNREDDGNRKYIQIEMGQYFDTVLKPRLQKVVFSNNWKDGIPQDKDGQSHAFKYHFIESYEDALNNIDFKNKNEIQQAMEFDDYMLKYMLDFETKGVSATLLKDEAFKTPFDYELNIQRGHESPTPEKVDLVETFHYLIGLWVQTLRSYEHQGRKYIISKGEIRDEDAIEDVLVVWRHTEDLDLDEEADWISKEIIEDQTFDRIYVNGASKIKDAEPTEITFREKMFEGVA